MRCFGPNCGRKGRRFGPVEPLLWRGALWAGGVNATAMPGQKSRAGSASEEVLSRIEMSAKARDEQKLRAERARNSLVAARTTQMARLHALPLWRSRAALHPPWRSASSTLCPRCPRCALRCPARPLFAPHRFPHLHCQVPRPAPPTCGVVRNRRASVLWSACACVGQIPRYRSAQPHACQPNHRWQGRHTHYRAPCVN